MTTLTNYEIICHPLYLIVSGGLNFPPLVFGMLGLADWCNYYSNWLLGNAALTTLNLFAGIYCVHKIRHAVRPLRLSQVTTSVSMEDIEKSDSDTDSESDPTNEVPTPPVPSTLPSSSSSSSSGCFSRLIRMRTTSSDRIRHLVCYDGIITTYAILFLFWVFWLSEGIQRVRQAFLVDEVQEFEGCMGYHERYMKTSLICGFSYFSFVVIAGLASFC